DGEIRRRVDTEAVEPHARRVLVRSWRYGAGIAAGFAVAAVACWWWRIFEPAAILVGLPSPSANSGSGDIYVQTFPMWRRAAQWMAQGEMPLWNPYQYAGHPFLATALYGVLSPIAVLARMFPTA